MDDKGIYRDLRRSKKRLPQIASSLVARFLPVNPGASMVFFSGIQKHGSLLKAYM